MSCGRNSDYSQHYLKEAIKNIGVGWGAPQPPHPEMGGCGAPVPEMKPTNPKDAVGSDKLPLHLVPPHAVHLMALGLLDGALKYGRANWREAGVRFTIYYDACRRHLDALLEGEDFDPDSGLPHLAHALACLAIMADAKAAGLLNDDRNKITDTYREGVNALTHHVARVKALHADRKQPRHYTIADSGDVI